MKILSRLIILFVAITIVLISCSTKPSIVLSERKMVEVFEDLYLIEAMARVRKDEYGSDKYKDALINSVLAKHGITQAQLDSSLVWYADNISIYSEIQDTVSAKLQLYSEKLQELNNKRNMYKLSRFDVKLPEHYALDIYTPTFRFKIDSTRLISFEKEKWRFSFDTQGIDTTLHRIESTIYYQYKDTLVIDRRKLLADDSYVFNKPALADSLLKEISGYVHMVMATNKMPKVLLSNIRNIEEPVVDSLAVDTVLADSLDVAEELVESN